MNFGLLDFKPKSLVYICEPKEFFQDGKICIINIENISISINDELLIEKNGRLEKVIIEDIQLNEVSVPNASNGELGLKLNKRIEKKSILWKRLEQSN